MLFLDHRWLECLSSLREIRHLLFDEAFLEELSKIYAEAATGHPPVLPAQLALTVILQAYTKASDAEAIESLTMDRRWQLVVLGSKIATQS